MQQRYKKNVSKGSAIRIYVSESLVIDKGGKLTALIVPGYEQPNLGNITDSDLPRIMEETRDLSFQISWSDVYNNENSD